jgi:hypothetical protein
VTQPANPPPSKAPPSLGPPRAWTDPRLVMLAFAVLTSLLSMLQSWQANRAAPIAEQKTDYAYDALRTELARNSRADWQRDKNVREIRDWLAEYLARQQVALPVTSGAPPIPTIVVAQPGAQPPPRQVLRPLARELPPLPEVKPAAAGGARELPESVGELLPE